MRDQREANRQPYGRTRQDPRALRRSRGLGGSGLADAAALRRAAERARAGAARFCSAPRDSSDGDACRRLEPWLGGAALVACAATLVRCCWR